MDGGIEVKLTLPPGGAFLRWLEGVERATTEAAGKALTRTAAGVRAEITRELPTIFRSVVPLTRRAVLYTPAKAEDGLEKMRASVFVKWDGSPVQPAQYLAAEILGGQRRDKRSEHVLKGAGIMSPGQQWVPGSGAGGMITGGRMTQILSQVRAFGQMGYNANATARTTKRLKKKGVLVGKKTGTNYFVATGKWTDAPVAIYQIVGKGRVAPILWFVDRKPTYPVRFRFSELVASKAAGRWPAEMQRALREAVKL